MNKKILSVLVSVSLLFGTLSTSATSIDFEEIDTDDILITYNQLETENDDIPSLEATENTNISFENVEQLDNNETQIYSNTSWNFDYTGDVQEFVAPYSGKYKLEVWGAQGGDSAVSGGLGGYGYVEIALLKDEHIYITIGEKGQANGDGGYNGGGAATLGGSGGGATSITKTNRGELKNYINNKEEVLVVAGGGGGSYESVLPNQDSWKECWDDENKEFYIDYFKADAYTLPGAGGGSAGDKATPTDRNEKCECIVIAQAGTDSSGYAFGLGESGSSGAGGGWYGGYSGKTQYLSSAGGSGFIVETEFQSNMEVAKNTENGKAKITYEGELERTITIKTNNGGTYDEKTGNVELKVLCGEQISLKDINCFDGFKFLGYFDEDGNQYKDFVMGKENLNLIAKYIAPLVIDKEFVTDDRINIYMSEDDEIDKYFYVYQSKDGKTWYDAILSINAKGNIPSKNMTYTPGSYTFIAPMTGEYKIRLYGAKGGNANGTYSTVIGGKGAYTEGIISLNKGQLLYVNIGEQGKNGTENRHGYAKGSGGHASDIRVISNTIANRIMVAAGGGGGTYLDPLSYNRSNMPGTDGGALTSANAKVGYCDNSHSTISNNNTGATQTRGGQFYRDESYYGYGKGTTTAGQTEPIGNGGYGYYCGASADCVNWVGGGAGGSSYISGYSGCKTFTNYVFKNTKMTAGARNASGYGYIDLLSDTYTFDSFMKDIYLYDTDAPNKPSDASIQISSNKVTISFSDNGDNGTKYYHKVESYNAETDELLHTSNILEDFCESGVKGFYYYIDTNQTGTVTTSNSTFINSTSVEVTKPSKTSYIHIATIDHAGNLSGTYTYEIPLSANYTVKHYKMDLDGNYVLEDTIVDTATIGTNITPAVKTYEGFTSPKAITKTVTADGKTIVEYYYERNKYPVTYIDKDKNGNEIGRTTKMVYYDADVRGSELGDDTSDNKYYSQYQYISDTTAKVTTNGATVYRIFEFCKTEAKSNLQWNDNNDADGFRPEKYKLKLKQNGKIIDEIELLSDTTNYTFPNLPKYDENGTPYQYTFDVDASERYNIRFDDNGNLIVEDYLPANFSVIIPKQIVLDGNTGKADYQITVNGKFYYNDTLTVQPESSLMLTDRSKISTMQAEINQIKTGFTKEDDVSKGCNTNGSIQINRTLFPGSWSGAFNFDIKFIMQN